MAGNHRAGDTVSNRGHTELANTVVDVVPAASSLIALEPDHRVRLDGAGLQNRRGIPATAARTLR